jgi:hypothetical protein|tara:strand:+ start:1785 stop:2027 length:243 start_codon:yes stop_codon:yes gene_type:complete
MAPQTKNRAVRRGFRSAEGSGSSALTSLEPWIALIDDIHPTMAADDAAILISRFRRLKRIPYFHCKPLRQNAAVFESGGK